VDGEKSCQGTLFHAGNLLYELANLFKNTRFIYPTGYWRVLAHEDTTEEQSP
jgi:hypothetical protein